MSCLNEEQLHKKRVRLLSVTNVCARVSAYEGGRQLGLVSKLEAPETRQRRFNKDTTACWSKRLVHHPMGMAAARQQLHMVGLQVQV